MTILRDISFLWSMLHLVVLFLMLFEPRFSWRTTITAGFTGTLALFAVNSLLMMWKGPSIIMSAAFFTCTVPSFLLFFALSKYRDGRFFFLFCLTDTMCFWILQLTNFMDRMTGDTCVVMLISRLIAFPLAELFLWRYLRRPYLELQSALTRGWWMFAAIGGTYYILIMFTSVPARAPMPDAAGIVRILLVLLLMPLTYLTILNSLWRQMQVYEGIRQLEIQQRDYRTIRQKVELGRMFRHDMRHHLLALDGMLQQGDAAGAQQYIRELHGRMSTLTQANWCANPAVNAVLAGYLTQAEEAACRVDAQVRIPAALPFSEMDLCIILANTLENAVHACRDIPEPSERWLVLRLELLENSSLILDLENPCPVPVKFDADGLPEVNYQAGHGLGLRSVRSVTDRCGGLFRCQWENGRFKVRAVLFPKEK